MYIIGIDVAADKKGQAVAVVDLQGVVLHIETGCSATNLAEQLTAQYGTDLLVAIDGPRMPTAPKPGPSGRACERQLVHELGLRIQWTPKADDEERLLKLEWMRNSFLLFQDFSKHLQNSEHVIEVFPSAAYTLFDHSPVIHLPLGLVGRKDKADQLDAVCCAAVGLLHAQGCTRAFGLNDPEGAIIVPASDLKKLRTPLVIPKKQLIIS